MENQQFPACGGKDHLVPLSCSLIYDYDYDTINKTGKKLYGIPAANEELNSANHYHWQIPPQLQGGEIRACCHGWLILSRYPENLKWLLWNPLTLKLIHLPPLKVTARDQEDDQQLIKLEAKLDSCCLSSPPSDPDSVLLFMRFYKPHIAFCRLRRKRKRWTWMSYSKQIENIKNRKFTGHDILVGAICTNGKVYAISDNHVILIDIVVKDKSVLISLMPFVTLPVYGYEPYYSYLMGSSKELFTVTLCHNDLKEEEIQSLHLMKLDMSTMMWQETRSAKDHVFVVNLDCSRAFCLGFNSGSGTYVHIINTVQTRVYSYNMENKTMSLLPSPCPDIHPRLKPGYISVCLIPEHRFDGGHGKAKCRTDTEEEQGKEENIHQKSVNLVSNEQPEEMMNAADQGHILDLPLHILELIANCCVAVEYLNFHATCKRFQLAAPQIHWSTGKAMERLRSHCLVSPWLMVLDKDEGIITFTDPKFGYKYFMTTFPNSVGDGIICCSKFGWVLLFSNSLFLIFFNPFTRRVFKLPELPVHGSTCSSFGFSAPPTSPDCIVAGLSPSFGMNVYITSPGKTDWDILDIGPDVLFKTSFHSCATFYGQDLYVSCQDGELGILRMSGDYSQEILIAEPPTTPSTSNVKRYLVEYASDLLSVVVGEFGEFVEVFKLDRTTPRWEKVESLGKHMIYVCGAASFSAVAKIPGMENKVYFPRYQGGNVIFYSLDTCKFHTFGGNGKGKNKEAAFTDFFLTKEQLLCTWIEPSWSS